MKRRVFARRTSLAWVLCLSLAACGGGGGVNSTPTPTPGPTPTPSPTPTSINFDTAEYRRTEGALYHGAITAWQAGASGQGITVGVIDTGIDLSSPEFSGRISSASRAFGGNTSYQDQDGHGTAVTGIIAAARNDSEIVGIAFNSTILALRADHAGSCSGADGCEFFDSDIAAALDRATSSGARVVNLSLGGAGASNGLLAAVDRATQAGIIVVVSAGNEGDQAQPEFDPNNPSPFATALLNAGNGLVIIATSVDGSGSLSTFSNRAGSAQNAVLSALGEGVRSLDLENNPNSYFLYSGTSFSAPQVSGAAALLAQAFPNLTSAQIVQRLLETARDAGATGTDSIYGRGILDIAAAMAPAGTTSLAGSSTVVSLNDSSSLSAPMGDSASSASFLAVVLDSYGRAYQAELGGTLRIDNPSLSLAPVLRTGERRLSASEGGMRAAVTISAGPNGDASVTPLTLSSAEAGRARARAGYIASRMGSRAEFVLGFSQGAGSLSALLRGSREPAFLIASSPALSGDFRQDAQGSLAFRRGMGALGLTIAGESGDTLIHRNWNDPARNDYRRRPYTTLGIGLDGKAGLASFSLITTQLLEKDTVLGARFSSLLGAGSARTLFLDARLRLAPGKDWGIGAAWRQGWTWVASGGALKDGALLKSNSFAFDVWKDRVLDRTDRLAFRIAQPLRVRSGSLNLTLPGSYDYATGAVGYAVQHLNLAPHGRQIDMEAAYSRALGWGDLAANVYYRKDSGNIASYPDDAGIALRFSSSF